MNNKTKLDMMFTLLPQCLEVETEHQKLKASLVTNGRPSLVYLELSQKNQTNK